ncbi:MAG TPA: hypothetical protein VMB05_01960 [Solirubrobacteraceae bacterium]|nr:hypothetical protein [Solirubrobacteraceae bacterium]
MRRRELAAVAALTFCVPFWLAQREEARSLARAARSQHLTVTAHLHYVAAKGSYLIEEGSASGALAGKIRARVRITADITGSFTFYSNGGSVNGYGSAKLHESGSYASFGGTLKVLGGSGRYAHAHGSGNLYGVYDRRSPRLELTIQTTGSLSY